MAKLFEALQSASQVCPDALVLCSNYKLTCVQLPDEARAMAVEELETLTGVARGLTRVTDSLLALDDSPEMQAAIEEMARARQDPRVLKLRDGIMSAIRAAVELWSTDAAVCDVSICTISRDNQHSPRTRRCYRR